MEKEFLKSSSRSVTLNITGGKIDSYREQEETTGTVRVYADGKIGVAGCLGEPEEEQLTAQAESARTGTLRPSSKRPWSWAFPMSVPWTVLWSARKTAAKRSCRKKS